MQQEELRLGKYCVDHHITLDDLQLFSNEILKYRTLNLDATKKHFKNFCDSENKQLVSGDLVIDRNKLILKKDGHLIPIRKHEFLILCLLASNPHEIVSDREIQDLLENYGYKAGYRSMIVYLSRISQIIGDSPINKKYIGRKRNKGYYWDFVTYIKK